MNARTTTRFEVSEVRPATEPLAEVAYKQAVEALLTPSVLQDDHAMIEDLARNGFRFARPQPPIARPVEACARYHGRLVADVAYHPVVAAAHRAFSDHRPLCLSPDMIWLMIGQAVANHVNAHAEELRPRFVSHQGQAQIVVRRNDFVKGSPENPWAEVLGEFSGKIREHAGPASDLFRPRFSTSGPVEEAAADVVLMDTLQSYFDLAVRSSCGIPSITLEGTTEDWESLADRAESFAQFGLERWIALLRPILGQFARASRGDVDLRFWRSLYKLHSLSGGPVITGWIAAFFPYLTYWETKRPTLADPRMFGEAATTLEELLKESEGEPVGFAAGPTFELLPGGLSAAPFRWEYLNRHIPMEFLGGFVGVAQDEDTLALRPEIGWAVRDAVEAA